MTFWGKAITFFPLFHLFIVVTTGIIMIKLQTFFSLIFLFFVIYLLPVLLFRIHNIFFPLKEGKSRIDLPTYSSWWASYNFQSLFHAFPFLESFLRLIPGTYSLWLRLWGSRIGKNVSWTPRVEIIDRSLIEIGDNVILGHKVIIVSHVVFRKKNGSQFLYIKKVRIGSGSFIGAGSKFGPGTVISSNKIIPFETTLTINKRV
jgi:hypothetical protein